MGETSPRERILLTSNWLFKKDDPAGAGESFAYDKLKPWVLPAANAFSSKQVRRPAGEAPGENVDYTQGSYDDSSWRKVNLPHDWAIEGPFKQEYPGSTGKLAYWGVGWYRKHFTSPSADKGRQVFLDIDGAMSYSAVWLNGKFVGGWPYGYSSYRLDLTPYLKIGADNVISIRLDNPKNSSRWYPGAGIYRNVWLVKTAPVHVAHWGVIIKTVNASKDEATIQISANIDQPPDTSIAVAETIYELKPDGTRGGEPVAKGMPLASDVLVKTGVQLTELKVKKPKVWNLDSPNLYCVVTDVLKDGKVVDQCVTAFGIRTIEFTADKGFSLNGKKVKLNGTCNHSDLGALGIAVNVRGLQRQIEILKEMGCNAIRTSHNMPAPELLDLCDRMGMLVMDESFDCWQRAKTPGDYHLLFNDWHEPDIRAEVRRDRNHPSIVLWSIGNEIPEQGSPKGSSIAAELTHIIHEEDSTRYSTVACSSTTAGYTDYAKAVDVFGYNYKPDEYTKFHETNPLIPLFGSETSSTVSTRGEYFFPLNTELEDFQVTSYDTYKPHWATLPDTEFAGQEKNPFVAGEFVWTGFDYMGEPTPYNKDSSILLNFSTPKEKAKAEADLKASQKIPVPSRSSYFGIVDLCGFKKDRFYLYQSVWRPDYPMAHIVPHWNWPERVGQQTPVFVYTSGDEAELFLNGASLGKKKKDPFQYRIGWDEVTYQPGELKVVAYKNGKEWATDRVKTTGQPAKILLAPDRKSIMGDGRDLCFVTVSIVDQNGLSVPRSHPKLQFAITGPGEIVATDNGDPTDQTSFPSTERAAFNGMALVIIRAKPGAAEKITLHAIGEGLPASDTVILPTSSVVSPLTPEG